MHERRDFAFAARCRNGMAIIPLYRRSLLDDRVAAATPEGLDMLRILIADDHEVVRRGLRLLLQDRPGWEICGEAATGRAAVAMSKELIPNIAILDLTMPDLNGLEATRQITAAVSAIEV